MDERTIPVVQAHPNGHAPKVSIYTDANGKRLLTRTELKRNKFVFNLKENYRKLKEALQFVEHFALTCGLSSGKIEEIRKANNAALEELSEKFRQKIDAYDFRIKKEKS